MDSQQVTIHRRRVHIPVVDAQPFLHRGHSRRDTAPAARQTGGGGRFLTDFTVGIGFGKER